MSTKFILIGGYLQKAPDGGKAFIEEFVRDFSADRKVRILDCVFADPESKDKKFKEDNERFSKFTTNFTIELASSEIFLEQLKSSDALFLRGGDAELLINTLKNCGNWAAELEGKTIAGTSAGAMALAKYSHALIKDGLIEGFGLVPVKVIAHWHSELYELDWEKALEKLENYKEYLPTYTLKEGEFVVIKS